MTTLFIASDVRGSMRVVREADSTPAAWFGDDPFGAALESQHGGDAGLAARLVRRYTGQVFEQESGLYHYGARLCDTALARFVATDPADQTPSPYAYCANDPVDHVDPDGRMITWILRYKKRYYLVDENGKMIAMVKSAHELFRLYFSRVEYYRVPATELLFNPDHYPDLVSTPREDGTIAVDGKVTPRGQATYFYAPPPRDPLDPNPKPETTLELAFLDALPAEKVLPKDSFKTLKYFYPKYLPQRKKEFLQRLRTAPVLADIGRQLDMSLAYLYKRDTIRSANVMRMIEFDPPVRPSEAVVRMLLPGLLTLLRYQPDGLEVVLKIVKTNYPAVYEQMVEWSRTPATNATPLSVHLSQPKVVPPPPGPPHGPAPMQGDPDA